MAAFLNPGGWGEEFSWYLDNYTHMAGMWLVGEDMPRETNRVSLNNSMKDKWGNRDPQASIALDKVLTIAYSPTTPKLGAPKRPRSCSHQTIEGDCRTMIPPVKPSHAEAIAKSVEKVADSKGLAAIGEGLGWGIVALAIAAAIVGVARWDGHVTHPGKCFELQDIKGRTYKVNTCTGDVLELNPVSIAPAPPASAAPK